MSLTSILNLNGGLLSQQSAQQTQNPSAIAAGAALAPGSTSALPQDSFTLSSQNASVDTTAQAAGLFSAPKSSGAQSPNAQSAPGSPNAATASNSSAASTSVAPGSVSQQTQLNTLNNALAALGLSTADIQEIDQIASLTSDFNPSAFTTLAYQLEAQSQNTTGPRASAQNTQAGVAGGSAVAAASTSTAATPPALQSFSFSSQSGSNGQASQSQTSVAATTAHSGQKTIAANS